MTENVRQRTALDRAGKCSGWIVGPEPLFLQKEEKAPQRRCLPRSGSSRKRCPSITKFRQIVPVLMLQPAAQNNGTLTQIHPIGTQRMSRNALIRCHQFTQTVHQGPVPTVASPSSYPPLHAHHAPTPTL